MSSRPRSKSLPGKKAAPRTAKNTRDDSEPSSSVPSSSSSSSVVPAVAAAPAATPVTHAAKTGRSKPKARARATEGKVDREDEQGGKEDEEFWSIFGEKRGRESLLDVLPDSNALETLVDAKELTPSAETFLSGITEDDADEIPLTSAKNDRNDSDDDDDDGLDDDSDDDFHKDERPDSYSFLMEDSEEEKELPDDENTVGDIPFEWYDDYDHIGYNQLGKKIARPSTRKDTIDHFLERDDGTYWRKVWDDKNKREIILTDQELRVLRNIQKGTYPDPFMQLYEEPLETVSDESIFPVSNAPEPKSRFQPSKWEMKKIKYLVKAIRNGHIDVDFYYKKRFEDPTTLAPPVFMIWGKDNQVERSSTSRLQRSFLGSYIAPRRERLPSHIESYNPPSEYLPTPEEAEEWKNMKPHQRPSYFLPQRFSSMHSIPAYNRFMSERFKRCMSLYLRPRTIRKKKPRLTAEDILPKLPKRKDLEPYPQKEVMRFKGHVGVIRSFSISPEGDFLVSAGDDLTVRIWEVSTGRCLYTWTFQSALRSVAWNPNPNLPVVAVVTQFEVFLLNVGTASVVSNQKADELLLAEVEEKKNNIPSVTWKMPTVKEVKDKVYPSAVRLIVTQEKEIDYFTWHQKGDYFATVSNLAVSTSVLVHRVSQKHTQAPFKKPKGQPQVVAFHPNKPFLFVASQSQVRVYNLIRQSLTKKLSTGVRLISSISIHNDGDNFIIGSYDRKVCWFDLDFSSKPLFTYKFHRRAVRAVKYHRKYPLFATCSDDGTAHLFHHQIFVGSFQEPSIVPLKILKGHSIVNDLGVLHLEFHPTQPWLFTCGADGDIILFA